MYPPFSASHLTGSYARINTHEGLFYYLTFVSYPARKEIHDNSGNELRSLRHRESSRYNYKLVQAKIFRVLRSRRTSY